jgi:hypothetical protein
MMLLSLNFNYDTRKRYYSLTVDLRRSIIDYGIDEYDMSWDLRRRAAGSGVS